MEEKITKWKELSREEVFKKYGRSIDKVVFELPNGGESDFYVKIEGPYVCTLGITEDNKVILAEQFRPGPNEVFLELPGGGMEKNENPQVAAEREFLEETGYQGNFQFIGKSYDDAYATTYRYCYVATNCKKIQEPRNDEKEPIKTVLLTLSGFRELLRSGKMTDVEVGYLGLDFLGLL